MGTSFADFSFEDLHPGRLAVTVLVAVLVIAVVVYSAGVTVLAPSRYEVSGIFADTAGLEAGDPVRVAGVEVGQVTDVVGDFDEGHVDVTWEVDGNVELGADTTVTVAIDGLLGGHNLTLEGPVEEPYLADVPEAERAVPIDRTRLASAVVQAIDDTSVAVAELDVDLMERLMGSLGEMAEQTEAEIDPLIDSVEVLARLLAERDEQLEALLEDSEQVTAVLAERDEQMVTLVEAADVVLAMLDRRRDELSALLGEGHTAVMSLADFVAEHRARIVDLVDESGAVLAVSERRISEINALLAQVGPTLSQLSATGVHGPWVDLLLTSLGPMPVEAITEEFGADVVYVAGQLYETLQLLRPVVAQEEDMYELLRTVSTGLPRGVQLHLTWSVLEGPEATEDAANLLSGTMRQLLIDLSAALQPALSLIEEPDGALRRLIPERIDYDGGTSNQLALEEDELVRVLTDLFTENERTASGYDIYFLDHVFPIIHPLVESTNDILEDPDRLLEVTGEILQDTDRALELLAEEFEEQMMMLEPMIEAVRRAMR